MASMARMAANIAQMTRSTLAKAILLGLNVMFIVMGFTMFILAAQFSQYTEQLSSIIKDGSVTLSLFSQPNTVLTMVGVVLILIGSQGAVGACFTSKRLLLAYHFCVLVLLTILIYVAGMMFIYREDAGTFVHAYWNDFNDRMLMLDTDWVAFVDEEAQDHISTRMRREMKRAGTALVVTGVFLLLALICTTDVLGWRYSVRRIGPTVNLCAFIFSIVLLTLSYLVATSSYDVPDSISAIVTVNYKIDAETSSRAVAFEKTLQETPAEFFQSAATEKLDNSVVFSPTLPSPPPPHKETAHPGSSDHAKENAQAITPPPIAHAALHMPPPAAAKLSPPPAAKLSPPPAAKLSPPPSLPVYAPNHAKTDLSQLMALPVQEWYTDSDSTEMVGFELGGKQLTFWPTKRDEKTFTPWDYHVTCVQEHAVMEAPSSANPESNWHVVSPHLGDDQMVEVHLQHAVYFAGQSYLKIYVGSNGFVTFDDHRFAMQLSLQAHYKRVMASVLFSDLNPEQGGVVRYTETADFLLVSWEDVPEYAEEGKPAPKHSFQMKLWKDGHLDMRWPKYTPSQNAVIVGVSGGKVPEKHGAGVSTLNLLELADPTLHSVCSGGHHPEVTHGMVDPTNAPTEEGTTPAPTAAPKPPTPALEIQHEAPVMEFYVWGGSDSDTDSNNAPNATNKFSLTGRTVTFAPTALHRDPYLWDYAVSCVGESHSMENPPTSWHKLSDLKDDGTQRIELEWPVPFNGRTYAAVYVGANGFINLETPRSPNMVSMRAHYSELRISALFTDLNPEAGGTVRWTQTDEKLLVSWEDVPEYSESTAADAVRKHSFQMCIRKDGHIDMRWPKNDDSRLDALVGVSTKIMGWQTQNLTHLDAADATCDATLSLQSKPAEVLWAPGQNLPPNLENQAEPTQEFGEPTGTDSDATMGPINGLDLEGKKLVFYPANYSSSNYNFSRWAYNRVCDSHVTHLEEAPAGHAWKKLAHPMDDTNVKVRPAKPVTYDGVAYDWMRIGSNGWIGFDDTNVGMMPTLDNHFTRVGVSALFTDLNPSADGTIRWVEADDFVLVSWEDVPAFDPSQFPHNPPNAHVPVFTFQCKLWRDGRIELSYIKAPASRMYTVVGLSTGLKPVEYESTKLLLINGGDCSSDPTLTTIPVADLPPSKSWSDYDYDYGPYDYSDDSTRRHLLGLETTDMTKWKWPATAVWVQNVGSTTFNHEVFIVAFTITFSGTNISMFEKHHHTFQDRLRSQIAAGAAVGLHDVEVTLLDSDGNSHLSINGAWAAQMLSVSAFTACVVTCFGLLGSFSEMDRKFLLWHTLATALVAAFVTLSSFLAIGHANSTENMMNRRWDKIDNGEEHLSVVDSTQLVDNNMRMVGLLGCACVFLLVVAEGLSILALFVLPPPRRHRLRRDHKESGSDTEEEEDGELLAKSKKGSKGKEAGGSSAVVVEMQQLQDLLERTAGAAMGKPEAASTAARKKFYGDNADDDDVSDDDDGAPVDASLAQAIGAGLSTVMAKVGKGGVGGASKKSKQKAKADRDAVQLPTMTPQDTNKLVAHYLGQGPGSSSSSSKPASTFTLDD